ncbi:MAG TPA: hypothetical protein VLG40_02720 [Candidatus Saccharimonas sp.]|nr:hypothetical protein [Candidatus Saccharimonas sp.]
MVDTFFYIQGGRIRSSNGDPNDNLYYLEGKFIHGPKNSCHYWLEGNQFMCDNGFTGFMLQGEKIFGPSQHLPWFD